MGTLVWVVFLVVGGMAVFTLFFGYQIIEDEREEKRKTITEKVVRDLEKHIQTQQQRAESFVAAPSQENLYQEQSNLAERVVSSVEKHFQEQHEAANRLLSQGTAQSQQGKNQRASV